MTSQPVSVGLDMTVLLLVCMDTMVMDVEASAIVAPYKHVILWLDAAIQTEVAYRIPFLKKTCSTFICACQITNHQENLF